MRNGIRIRPLRRLARLGDRLMEPVMRRLSGARSEEPQRTHRWNYHRFGTDGIDVPEPGWLLRHEGVSMPPARCWFEQLILRIPILGGAWIHSPVLGGWRDYVVLAPERPTSWHPAWITSNHVGVSRHVVRGQARLLLGSGPVKFLGFDGDGRQIRLHEIGRGRIGDGGPYAQIPLF